MTQRLVSHSCGPASARRWRAVASGGQLVQFQRRSPIAHDGPFVGQVEDRGQVRPEGQRPSSIRIGLGRLAEAVVHLGPLGEDPRVVSPRGGDAIHVPDGRLAPVLVHGVEGRPPVPGSQVVWLGEPGGTGVFGVGLAEPAGGAVGACATRAE